MKPLNTIVADLEYCREIKKLGVKQKSIFGYWILNNNVLGVLKDEYGNYGMQSLENGDFSIYVTEEAYVSAWTASELKEILIKLFKPFDYEITFGYNCCYHYGIIDFSHDYLEEHSNTNNHVFYNRNEASMVAEIIIYLLKNNIISLEEVNKYT